MFNEVYDIEGILKMLELERILFEHDEGHTGNILCGDDYYITAWESMASLSSEVTELEATDSILYKFRFSEMHTFYSLCKEYSKLHKINFKKNPYVKAAEKFVDSTFRSSDARNFAWNLWVPPKLVKKRAYTVIVETGTYFEDYIEILKDIYSIKEYYVSQCKALENELYGKSKIIQMPTVTKEERKAAC